MAGFGNTMSKLIEEDREYYRELATKKRDYLQTYGTKAVLDRDEKANGALSVFNTLVTAGIPEEDLRYVLDTTGVPGLAQLSSTLSSRSDLTKSEIAGLVKKSKDYVAENPDEDISTVLRRAYGLYKSADNPVDTETNLFSAVLGLDSRMMEREALNDVYIDGFKGTDLYAIMARGGPKPGEALSLNLPTKPPSTSEIKMGYESLQTRFEQTIDAKIKALTQSQSDDDTDVEAARIVENIKALNDLKGRGVLGYAKLGEIDPTFMDYAKSLEETRPGIITRNPTMIEFGSAYTSYWGDKEDNAKLDSAPNGGETPSGQGTPTGVITFKTASEFEAAVEAGEIKPNTKVKVGSNSPQVFTPPPSYNYNVSDEFPLEEDNRARLLSESTDTPQLEVDNRSRLLSEATAPKPEDMTPATAQGLEHRDLIVDLGGAISEGWESGNTLLASSEAAGRGALFNGIANFVDYFGALTFKDIDSNPLSGSLREAAEKQKEKAAEIAAEGWAKYIEDNTGQEVPYTETEKAKELFATRVAQYPMRLPGETPQEFMIRTGKRYELKGVSEETSEGTEVLTDEQTKALKEATGFGDRMVKSLHDTQGRINDYIASFFRETIEERMMKIPDQQNRKKAFDKLKELLSNIELFPQSEEDEIVANARALLSDEANARIDAGTNIIEQRRNQSLVSRPNK